MLVVLNGCTRANFYPPRSIKGIQPRISLPANLRLTVGVYDGRPDSTGFGVIEEAIGDAMRRAYPTANVQMLAGDVVRNDSPSGAVTVRVVVVAHATDFGSEVLSSVGRNEPVFDVPAVPDGQWNHLSGFVVTVLDRTAGETVSESKSLSSLVSKPRNLAWTPQAGMDAAFSANVEELLLLVDAILARRGQVQVAQQGMAADTHWRADTLRWAEAG